MPISLLKESSWPVYRCAGFEDVDNSSNTEESPSDALRRYARVIMAIQELMSDPWGHSPMGDELIRVADVKKILREMLG
jgi:hypothetical protein